MKQIALCITVFSFLVCNSLAIAAKERSVSGTACYQYGDSETPLNAKQIATDLAKRNALENYITYVASSTKVENFELKKDSIITAGSGYLHNMKVVSEKSKDREYCVSVTATVIPDEVKDLIKKQLAELKKDAKSSDNNDGGDTDAVERVNGGSIDWGKRVIRVTGLGVANKTFPKHIWKKDAEDNAYLDAQTKILEISKGVDLEAKKFIENYQTREQSARKSVAGRVKKTYQIGKTKFSADGDTAEIIMEAKLPEE